MVLDSDSYPGLFSMMEAITQNEKIFRDNYDVISQTLSSFSNAISKLVTIEYSQSLAQVIPQLMSKEYCNSMLESIEVTGAVLTRAAELLIHASNADDSAVLDESTVESLQKVTPLVPEEQQEKFQSIISPKPKEKGKILSIENVKWLLGIVLPILVSLYLHNLPDKNAEKSLRLQETQTESINELSESAAGFSETFEQFIERLNEEGLNINLNINMIENGNNTALEIVDSADDLVVPDTQNNDADSQGTNQHPQP